MDKDLFCFPFYPPTKKNKLGVLDMTLNCTWWGDSYFGTFHASEVTIIAITPRPRVIVPVGVSSMGLIDLFVGTVFNWRP